MLHNILKTNHLAAKSFALSVLLTLLLFYLQGDKGFSLWDEGFLWYGAQRVMQGEVPIRDFMAYDPGRYYWAATLMSLIGNNGIMSLRAAVAIFQALGLFVGIFLIAGSAGERRKSDYLFWLLAAVTLLLWMYPRHKLFDISLSLFLIGILSYLVQKPLPARYFVTGLCVGLVAVFGRNHGVYGVVGSLGVIGWLSIKRTSGPTFFKGFTLWAAGVTVGFLPVLLMVAIVPGFAAAFWDSIRFLFELKATNLPLPVPWPWTVSFSRLSLGSSIHHVLVGLFFLGALVFGVAGIFWVVRQRLRGNGVQPSLVAAAFLALPYAQDAFSRADITHLAQGIFPLLVGCLVLLASQEPGIKWPFAVALWVASMLVMFVVQPGWQCRASSQCVDVVISGNSIAVDRRTAGDIALLRELASKYAPNGQSVIVAPFWPGAYALLGRRSPMWETYSLFSRPPDFEQEEIERIRASRPGLALVLNISLDGRDDLRFANTHPLIYRYIVNHFERVPYPANPEYQIYKARNVQQ